jgi:hypothetical protein
MHYIKLFYIDASLSGYHKKKYVAKLIYIYILGWDVDFGHLEAVQLLQSPKYSEKQIVGPGHVYTCCHGRDITLIFFFHQLTKVF